MSDNNLSGTAENHFRNVAWKNDNGRRPVFNRGGSARVDPFVPHGVPYYLHDFFGLGRHAKIVSTKAADLLADGKAYRSLPPLTGDESVATEVNDVAWPELLDEIDDVPPATTILSVTTENGQSVVRGVSHDNGEIVAVDVNGTPATFVASASGVVDWQATLPSAAGTAIVAFAKDGSGNIEQTAHRMRLE